MTQDAYRFSRENAVQNEKHDSSWNQRVTSRSENPQTHGLKRNKRLPVMRILVVEDEVALREDLRTQLTDSGFGVDVAGDGEEGLFAGLNYPLDAAIVDLGLPIRSG